jgi:hypothetical protein
LPKPKSANIPSEVLQGHQCQLAGRTAEAELLFRKALRDDPRQPHALHQLGVMSRERGDLLGALALFAATIRSDRGLREAHSNHGLVLHELGRHEEAIESFNRVLIMDRDNVLALYNRGLSLLALNRPREALVSFLRAATLQPDHADAHYSSALAALLIGNFRDGWQQYEWRWRAFGAAVPRAFTQPLWLGDTPLEGKTVLLHAEQGMGDAIQFVRYAPLVAQRARSVILAVHEPLKSLLARVEGVGAVFGLGDALPPFDLQCPLLSLPLGFRTELDTIPGREPYLRSSDAKRAIWSERLPRRKPLRVGLVWAGNPDLKNDRNRSIPLERMAPLLAIPDLEFVSLQRDVRASDAEALMRAPELTDIAGDLQDFDDTAAVVSLLDLVIAVDTSVAHLAGALGKPVWLLLPFGPDPRWMLDREDSPWYPTARLFRQPKRGDWDSVLARICAEIGKRRERNAAPGPSSSGWGKL